MTGKVQVNVSVTRGKNYQFELRDKVRHAVKIVKSTMVKMKDCIDVYKTAIISLKNTRNNLDARCSAKTKIRGLETTHQAPNF